MIDWQRWQPFAKAIASEPGNEAIKWAARDWLEENGFRWVDEVFELAMWADVLPMNYYGRGIGSGSGRGRGSGKGGGKGGGVGRGKGRGSGIGRGIGSGKGRGIGSGIGSGNTREVIMEPGNCYLILTVDWYAFCGRCIRQVGPYEYEFEKVSKFDTNAGDVFGEIAAGDKALRNRATYQHFQGKAILGMGRVAVFEWKDKLPQEYAK